MLLMLRLLATTLLLSSFAYADASDQVEDFLTEQFSKNPNLRSVEVHIDEIRKLQEPKNWSAYIVTVNAVIKKEKNGKVKQKMVWFSDGNIITQNLTNMQSGQTLTDMIKPNFKDAYYKETNLIYGNANARHKVAIFSDPLCPYCKKFVPKAIKEMQKDPQKYAIYYYHLPLTRIHPASSTLIKVITAAELQGVKDVLLKAYAVELNPREKSEIKILAAFNKAVGTKITLTDIKSPAVLKQIKFDATVANDMMVAGTPTLYVDGKIDRTKNKYKKVK